METKSVSAIAYDAKYDILKFGLSILVVAIHASVYPLVLYPWLRIAVPLFFILSSYFLFSKLKDRPEAVQRGELKKFAARNGKLYLFWFVVLLPFTLYIRRTEYFAGNAAVGLYTFLRGLLFGSTFVASWYIPASVIGVWLVWFFSRKWKQWLVFAVSVLAFCIVTLLSSYPDVVQGIPVLSQGTRWYTRLFGNPVVSFPAAVFWVFVGKCFSENRMTVRSGAVSGIVLVVSCAGLFAEWQFVRHLNGSYNNDSYFMLAPVCICLFQWLQRMRTIEYRPSRYLRRASTVIYVTHGSLVYAIGFVCRKLLRTESDLLVFFAALFGSLLIYAALEVLVRSIRGHKLACLLRNAF